MKVSGSVKQVTKRLLQIIKASSNEPADQVVRYKAFLKLALKHEQVFEKSFERALKAKIASPVDPVFLKAEFDAIKGEVAREKQNIAEAQSKRSDELRKLARESEIERLGRLRDYAEERLAELAAEEIEQEPVVDEPGEATETPNP